MLHFNSSREFFAAAREASIEVARYDGILELMEHDALGIGSPSFGGSVRGGDPDRISRRVSTLVDTEAKLYQRIEYDYGLIDLANAVIYGSPQMDGIADLIRQTWWADAVSHHYLGLKKWNVVDALVGHPRSWRGAYHALDAADKYNLVEMHIRHHDAEGWTLDV